MVTIAVGLHNRALKLGAPGWSLALPGWRSPGSNDRFSLLLAYTNAKTTWSSLLDDLRDTDLMLRVREGDDRAFAELYARYN